MARREASYAIMVDGALRSSQNAERHETLFDKAPGGYVHTDRIAGRRRTT